MRIRTTLLRVLFFVSVSMCLVFSGCSCGRYERPLGSIWQSSNPEMWFAFNVDGTTEGELIYNSEVIRIIVVNRPAWNGIGLMGFWREGVASHTDGCLIECVGIFTSDTKIILQVRISHLPDFNEEQIVFIRVN